MTRRTDLDFFTRGGNTYASVGTLGQGNNRGGQTIARGWSPRTGRPPA